MQGIKKLISYEPVATIALIVAVLNVAFNLSMEQQTHVRTILESLFLLLAGVLARSHVSPVAKLKDQGRA